MPLTDDLTFLADPDGVLDWRAVVLVDAALDAGLLDHLPGTPAEVAAAAGTDQAATRIVLRALAAFDIVVDDGAVFRPGPRAPADGGEDVVQQHARAIRRWSATLGARLAGVEQQSSLSRSRADTVRWLDSLAVPARRRAPELVDACLEVAQDATSVLDLAGGHGEYALGFARRGLETWMQDLPVVIDIGRARGRLEAAGITLFAGDFFEEVPSRSFDLVLLAGVAHACPLDRLELLYRNVHDVTDGTLVISAPMRDGEPRSDLMAVHVLTGRRRSDIITEDDHRRCLVKAGFSDVTRREFAGPSRHDLLVARA